MERNWPTALLLAATACLVFLRVNHARNVPYNYEWRHPRLSMTRWIFVAKSCAMQFKFNFAKYSPESLRLHYAKKHLSFSVLPAFCILFLKTKFLSILSLCLHLFYLKGCTKIFISNDWILLLMGGHPRTHCSSNDLEGSWEFLLWRWRAHCGGWLRLTDGPSDQIDCPLVWTEWNFRLVGKFTPLAICSCLPQKKRRIFAAATKAEVVAPIWLL